MLTPETVLKRFQIGRNLYLLGTFETGLTIYNQQVRALNLVWAMINAASARSLRRIAIVGGGFAGITAAAGLLHKGAQHVSLFEKRAALCPLQEGSDTRWVHPRIYDWPDEDSNSPTAALPLMNWNAGRASDVVVEILREWERLVRPLQSSASQTRINVYVNVKHLRLYEGLNVEWVGEKSNFRSPARNSGTKQQFDSVILAVGFGLELNPPSYWRNETLGQPQLDLGRRTYLVSGHGDGALVDLFRIRIVRFRQDRILVDLFENNATLLHSLRELKKRYNAGATLPETLYDEFEALAGDTNSGFNKLLPALRMRLRADTAAILQMSDNVDSFRKVFASPASFQNRFLLFALYRAGGVIPTSKRDVDQICSEYGIAKTDVIRRHGTDRVEAVKDVLDKSLWRDCKNRVDALRAHSHQPSLILWTGGYWHQRSDKLHGRPLLQDVRKDRWRLEHLPPATEVLATGFVAAVAGFIAALGSAGGDFRVTLHRALYVGSEVTLQQASQYDGNTVRLGSAGRTFGFNHGTIGYAAVRRKVVRTRPRNVNESDDQYAQTLRLDMQTLELTAHSQSMAPTVRSILAVPILTPNGKHTMAVLYADSTRLNAFNDKCASTICCMCESFAAKVGQIHFDRVRNFPISPPPRVPRIASKLDADLEVIRTIETPRAPSASNANYLNLEFTDFIVAGD